MWGECEGSRIIMSAPTESHLGKHMLLCKSSSCAPPPFFQHNIKFIEGRFKPWTMRSDHGRWHFPWSNFIVQLSWSHFLKNQSTKFLGSSVGVYWTWTKRSDHAPKNECVNFLRYAQKRQCWKKRKGESNLTILLSSFVFASLIFLFSLVYTLNFNKHGCKGSEEEETYFALRIIHVFVHACEACCGHSSLDFGRKTGKICNFELGLWEYGT